MKQLLFSTLILAACSSCDPAFPGGTLPGGNISPAGPYFLDATLQFPDGQAWPLGWYADADPTTQSGENGYLIAHRKVPAELYTAFDGGFVLVDTGALVQQTLQAFEQEYGFTYGMAAYNGLGFAFFHPEGNGLWDAATADGFFQPGRELPFGTGARMAEVGHYKNWPELLQSDSRGFLTSPMSNDGGFLLVEAIQEAVDEDGQAGRQVQLSFECRLFKQYHPDEYLDIVGKAAVFVPVE